MNSKKRPRDSSRLLKGLRHIREIAGLSQEQLEKEASISIKSIARYENLQVTPRPDCVPKLYEVLNKHMQKIGRTLAYEDLFNAPLIESSNHLTPQRLPWYYKARSLYLAWSATGIYLASGHRDHTVQIWNIGNGERSAYTEHTSGWVREVAWCHKQGHENVLASVNGGNNPELRVWEISQGLQDLFVQHFEHRLTCVAWSPDGECVACAGINSIVEIWNPWEKRLLERYEVPDTKRIYRVRWSPDGTAFAVGTDDGLLHIRSLSGQSGMHQPEAHTGRITEVVWSSIEKHLLATASFDGTVKLWNITSGKEVVPPYRRHTSKVYMVAWSPDGKFLASVSDDRTVHIWEPTTGNLVLSYPGRRGALYALCWSPDGKYIAFGNKERDIQIWAVR